MMCGELFATLIEVSYFNNNDNSEEDDDYKSLDSY